MVRRYLNKQERQDMVVLAGFLAFLENRIETWAKLGRSKEKVKYSRMAFSFGNKVLKLVLNTLDPQEQDKVIADTKNYSVAAYAKTEAVREYERLKQLEENMVIPQEDWYDLADHALVTCRKCTLVGEAVEKCNMRRIFIKHDVPPFDQYAPVGTCPFKQEG